jgi:hypothetical protein
MLMFAGATTPAGQGYSLCLSPTAGRFPVPRAPLRSGDMLKSRSICLRCRKSELIHNQLLAMKKFIEQRGEWP